MSSITLSSTGDRITAPQNLPAPGDFAPVAGALVSVTRKAA